MGTTMKDVLERAGKALVAAALATGALGPLLAALLGGHLDITSARTIYTAVTAAATMMILDWLSTWARGTISPASLVKAPRGTRLPSRPPSPVPPEGGLPPGE